MVQSLLDFCQGNNTLVVTQDCSIKNYFKDQNLIHYDSRAVFAYLDHLLPNKQFREGVHVTSDLKIFELWLVKQLPLYLNHYPTLLIIDHPELYSVFTQLGGVLEAIILKQHPNLKILCYSQEPNFPNHHYVQFFDQLLLDTEVSLNLELGQPDRFLFSAPLTWDPRFDGAHPTYDLFPLYRHPISRLLGLRPQQPDTGWIWNLEEVAKTVPIPTTPQAREKFWEQIEVEL